MEKMPVFGMVLEPFADWVPVNLPWEKTTLTSVNREHIVSTLVLKFSSGEIPSTFLNHTNKNMDSTVVIKLGSSELPKTFPKDTTRCNLGCYEFNVMLENLKTAL